MRALWVVMLVACAHEPVDTPKPQAAPITAKPAPLSPLAAKLANIDLFAVGGVGFAGETSHGEAMTVELAREPGAVAAFEQLLASDNRAAGLYAYWALRTLDPKLAAKHRARLAQDTTVVHAMAGCIGYDETTSKLIAEIDGRPAMDR